MYLSTGLNGPGIELVQQHLVARGYPDASLFGCLAGFPHGALPVSGLWPPAGGDVSRPESDLTSACSETWVRFGQWKQQHKGSHRDLTLLAKFEKSVVAGRRVIFQQSRT